MLKVGDVIPYFKAKDANGVLFESRNFIGFKPFVIYFYPKDNTSICTEQACGFRDQYEDFKKLGVEVIGVSSDSVDSHQDFSHRNKLNFTLLSDENDAIRKLFGISSKFLGVFPSRVTFVVDKNGSIQMVYKNIFAAKHISKSLEMMRNIIN